MKVEILKQKDNYFLWIDNELWMWDVETERKIQYELAHQAYGDVIVAGYGLGLVQKYLYDNPNVKSIVTIEKSGQIIKACKDKFNKIYGDYIIEDFYNYNPRNTSIKYDCVIGDIWKEIVPESLDDYKRFKTQALKMINPYGYKILAWGKDYFEYLIEKGNR